MPATRSGHARRQLAAPRPSGNAGAGRSESDSEMDSPQASDDDLPGDSRKRKWNGRKEFTLIKRWVTGPGEKAEMDSEDIEREKFKTVLFPRQHVLKTLDPDHTRSVAELRQILGPLKDDYMDLLDNEHDEEMNIEQALDVYETFHHLTRDPTWGKVPWPCSCPTCHKHCVCKHGTLFTSIFDSEVVVPKDNVADEPGDPVSARRHRS